MDSVKWYLEMQNKNWVTTEQFKKAMRNKKLRTQIGFEVTNCPSCRKTIVSEMSMAIPMKFHRYMGCPVYSVNNSGKPVMLLCKQCHKDNFKEIPGRYDKENKKFIDTYYEPTTPLGESILAMQSSGNGNGIK